MITLLGSPVIAATKENPWIVFAFFAFMMLLQLVWVLVAMPETKGVSLEDPEKKLGLKD